METVAFRADWHRRAASSLSPRRRLALSVHADGSAPWGSQGWGSQGWGSQGWGSQGWGSQGWGSRTPPVTSAVEYKRWLSRPNGSLRLRSSGGPRASSVSSDRACATVSGSVFQQSYERFPHPCLYAKFPLVRAVESTRSPRWRSSLAPRFAPPGRRRLRPEAQTAGLVFRKPPREPRGPLRTTSGAPLQPPLRPLQATNEAAHRASRHALHDGPVMPAAHSLAQVVSRQRIMAPTHDAQGIERPVREATQTEVEGSAPMASVAQGWSASNTLPIESTAISAGLMHAIAAASGAAASGAAASGAAASGAAASGAAASGAAASGAAASGAASRAVASDPASGTVASDPASRAVASDPASGAAASGPASTATGSALLQPANTSTTHARRHTKNHRELVHMGFFIEVIVSNRACSQQSQSASLVADDAS